MQQVKEEIVEAVDGEPVGKAKELVKLVERAQEGSGVEMRQAVMKQESQFVQSGLWVISEEQETSEGGRVYSPYLLEGCTFLRFTDFVSLQQVSKLHMHVGSYLLEELL
eukprot:4712991-Lingulodinium_polyedra.AAC.1